jgi:GTPase SAR1 family protein
MKLKYIQIKVIYFIIDLEFNDSKIIKVKKEYKKDDKRINYIKEHFNEFNNYYTKKKALEIDINPEQITKNQKKNNNKVVKEKEKVTKKIENQFFIQETINKNKDDDEKTIKPNNNINQKNIKIIVLGEHFSGKTSVIQRFIYNKITKEYITTTNIENFKCPFIDYNNNLVELTFIDTPPIHQIKNKLIFFFNDNIDIILFVFDVTNKGSFQRLIKYINDIEFNENMIIGIIANKQDLCPEYIKYKIHELKDYCYENNISFLVISILKDTEHIFDFLNIILSKKIFKNK